MACRIGNLKTVQKLIFGGANILESHQKKLPKEIAENSKIVFLLEKYEKLSKRKEELKKQMEEADDSDEANAEQSLVSSFIVQGEEAWLDQEGDDEESNFSVYDSFHSKIT